MATRLLTFCLTLLTHESTRQQREACNVLQGNNQQLFKARARCRLRDRLTLSHSPSLSLSLSLFPLFPSLPFSLSAITISFCQPINHESHNFHNFSHETRNDIKTFNKFTTIKRRLSWRDWQLPCTSELLSIC